MHDVWFYLRAHGRFLLADSSGFAKTWNTRFNAARAADISSALAEEYVRTLGVPLGARFSSLAEAESTIPHPPARVARGAWLDDRCFAGHRLRGPNVFALWRVTPDPSRFAGVAWSTLAEQIPMAAGTWSRAPLVVGTFEEALADKRLFAVDYSYQFGTRGGAYEGLVRPTLPAVVGLFYAGTTGLVPVAISTRGPDEAAPLVHTPTDLDWAVARHQLQVADFIDHQTRVHLGHVHYPLQGLIQMLSGTERRPEPLLRFLAPFFDCVELNMEIGARTLLGSGGIAETILQADHGAIAAFARRGCEEWSLQQLDPRVELERRGLDGDELVDFPYRRHALFLWSAYLRYVEGVLAVLYPDAAGVEADIGWKMWKRELAQKLGKRADLLDRPACLVAGIAFLSSATHSAVNYPQADLCKFFPAFPAAAYPSAGTGNPLVDVLPPIRAAQNQITVMQILAGRKFETLLQLTAMPGVERAFKLFRVDLLSAEGMIRSELAREEHAYHYLAPSEITLAANV